MTDKNTQGKKTNQNPNRGFSDAQWIWAEGKPEGDFQVCLFRCTISLDAVPSEPVNLLCGADSKYHLWVNGGYVNTGPARSHPSHPYYDTHDITPLLRPGLNTIAFRVQSYIKRDKIFAAVRGGLICQIERSDKVLAATGQAWKGVVSPAYQGLPGLLYAESFDARLEPQGWQGANFDDSKWPAAIVLTDTALAPRENFSPRPIPNLTQTRLEPARVIDSGTCVDPESSAIAQDRHAGVSWMRSKLTPFAESACPKGTEPGVYHAQPVHLSPPPAGESIYLQLDFGHTTLAHPELEIEGPAGVIVDLLYAERPQDGRVEAAIGDSEHHDRVISRDGVTQYRANQPRGFQYMALRISDVTAPMTIRSIAAYETIYAARPVGRFECSDPSLDRIFQLGARTVNLCMEDSYTDCIWRERSQYMGDMQPETLFGYYAFGAWDMARKSLREFAASNHADGWVPGVFPGTNQGNFPSWDLRFPVVAWEYYLFTADRETLEMTFASCQRVMDWFSRNEEPNGLLKKFEGWNFVDWSGSDWNDGEGALQGWYVEALDHCALMAHEFGSNELAARYEKKAADLRQTIADAYWCEEKGAYLKYSPLLERCPEGMPHDVLGQHENFLFCLLGIGTRQMRDRALEAMRGPAGRYLPDLGKYADQLGDDIPVEPADRGIAKIATPFWSFYALQALIQAGESDVAIEQLRLCYGIMLRNGATSCWELWDTRWSYCHGWSAAPVMILPAHVLGVRPTLPGFSEFEVRPHVAGLDWARGVIPSPKGDILVAWSLQDQGATMELDVTVPEGARANLVLPKTYAPADSPRVLSPGKHHLRIPRVN